MQTMNRLGCVAGVLLAAVCAKAAAATAPATVDWRDQVIYFAMIDRFDDGDPRNDDQHAGEFDPRDGAHYSGGDLRGLARRLDYIHGLGATALWITPPVAHQWWNTRANYGGYHGYWADDFSKVDPHFGTLADYRALADGLHARDMQLVQDIVVNHVADYFRYDVDPGSDPSRGYIAVPDARGRQAPTQSPFDLNDPRRARDRAAAIYHWTPDIRDFADPVQEQTWQLAGLDDLDTGNPAVRRALRASYGKWIRDVGVDAFRVDTAFYVPPAFFDDFLNSKDRRAPGILRVARDAGKPAFHVFGEGFGLDRAYDDTQARKIERYVRHPGGRALLPGMINFPLYGATLDVFARGHPTAEFADRIERMMRVHAAPQLMPTFVDNHDVDRFRAGASDAALRQALLAVMTLPGIPVIYYGTEQGFTEPRASMFAAGYGSGGVDHFDVASPGYRYLQRAIALRRANRVLSRGAPSVVAANAGGPGAIAWRMDDGMHAVLVAMNTADHPSLLAVPASRLAGVLTPMFGIDGAPPRWQPGTALVMPARAGFVWSIAPGAGTAAPKPPGLDAVPAQVGDSLHVGGVAAPDSLLRVAVDGNLASAVDVRVPRSGRWTASIDTADLVDPVVPHEVVAFDRTTHAVSPARAFRVQRHWVSRAHVQDAIGDDTGASGTYTYPTEVDGAAHAAGDLQAIDAETSGGALRLTLRMRELRREWNPVNGFDHMALTVYVALPGRVDGARVLPLQDATMPGGLRWQRRLRVGGWSNLLTDANGADAEHEGGPVTPGAQLSVDPQARTLQLVLPASALGNVQSLRGARIYVTTWDYDGGYRPIAPQPGAHAFGGGAAGSPKVLDDALLVLGGGD
jgi:glycosidase